MDLYRSKGLSHSKISFNDLTLQENLNYIKYDLKNTHEAFKLFDITKEKFNYTSEIAASLIQKLATRGNIHHKNFDEKLFSKNEYKAMFRQVMEHADDMDNKQLVDTLFGVGKLHKGQELAQFNKYGDYKFFQHFFRVMLTQVEQRVHEMSVIQQAYLCKGILNLAKYFDDDNKELEKSVHAALVDHCLRIYTEKTERFDPYSISKLMKFLAKKDDYLDTKVLTLFGYFGKQLVETISERQISLMDADLDDPLIDLQLHDIIDIVRIFSVLAKPSDGNIENHIPKLFESVDPQYQADYQHSEETYIQLYQPEL